MAEDVATIATLNPPGMYLPVFAAFGGVLIYDIINSSGMG
jgi:hypothetical protein